MGKLAWKVMRAIAATVAGVLARKALTTGWRATTGHKPPKGPEDPDRSWLEGLVWAVVSTAGVGLARRLATRKAARYYTESAGSQPPDGTPAA